MGKLFLVIIAAGLLLYYNNSRAPELPRSGIVAAEIPLQSTLVAPKIFQFGDYKVTGLARFSINARVLLIDTYYWSPSSDLSPIDFTLGWGRMSDSAVFSQLNLSHGYREYQWWIPARGELPISRAEITESSANMHLIPANDQVKNELYAVRQYETVSLKGYLVEVTKEDGWHWKSSMTRSDSGPGACELVWVESVIKP